MFTFSGKNILFGGAIAVSLLIPCQMAFAAEEPVLTTMKAPSVKVTATRTEKDLMEVPMSVSVITAEQIARSPATTVTGLFKDIPGVRISGSGNPPENRISIRGEGDDATLILVDGQKIVELNINNRRFPVDVSSIERIEIIRGGASVLYGSEALGGVINIITKKGGTKPIEGEATFSYVGAASGVRENIALFGSLNDFNYRVSGSYSDMGNIDGKALDGTSDEREDSDSQNTAGSGFLSYDFSENFTAGMGAEYFHRDQNGGRVYDHTREKVNIFAEGKDISSSLSKLRFDAFYQESVRNQNSDTSTWHSPTSNAGFFGQSDWAFGDSTGLIAGFELLRDEVDTNYLYHPETPRDSGIYINSRREFRKGTQDTAAAYGLMEHYLPSDFTLSYGVRYSYITTKAEVTHETLNTTAARAAASGNGGEGKPVISVGLVWTGIKDTAFRASFAQGYLVPDIRSQYVEAQSVTGRGTTITLANPDLKPESSENFEIGVRYNDGRWNADLAVFFANITDLIGTEDISVVGRTTTRQIQNLGFAKKFGTEGLLSYTFNNGIEPYTSFGVLRRKLDGEYKGSSAIPVFTGRGGVRYNKSFGEDDYWNFNADGYVSGESNTEDSEPDDEVAGHATVNLSFGLDWGVDHEFFVQAEFLNIFDKQYETNYSHGDNYQPGFNTNLVVGYRF